MKTHPLFANRSLLTGWVVALMLASGISAFAAPPDLTNGGVPTTTTNLNLGPTGLRGWMYHVGADTDESRQIQVKVVDAGSPASGKLSVGDVILGADGSGANPVNFTADARRSFADAINDAEARNPADLKVLRWRAGTTTTQTLTLTTLGAYTSTAPYNCPKSALILENALQSIMTSGETAGSNSLGTLALLAGNNPANPNNAARQSRAQTEARALIPNAAQLANLTPPATGFLWGDPWGDGHKLIVLTEYYLQTKDDPQTKDDSVLPAIDAYSKAVIGGQNLFGTYSHVYSARWRDGSPNGPMRNLYGTVNNASMPGWLGLLLTKECGVINPDLAPAIQRASRFYAYYSGKSAIPYGEHEAAAGGHENNGKSGLAAVCYALESHRAEPQKFFAKMAVASTTERDIGHTGPYFNHLWAPLGAAVGGETAAASCFSRLRWHFDLCRRWNGKLSYETLGENSQQSGSSYYGFSPSLAPLLVYALPLRQLHITGRGHDPLRQLSSQDVSEAEAVDGYEAAPRATSALITDLGNWSPFAQRSAAEELGNRPTETTALLPTLHAMATDPQGTSRVGATFALGYIGHASSVGILATLLSDPVNHVRYAAAVALREMPQDARSPYLNTVLTAAASNAAPLLPFNEEDPAHLSHASFGPLLFGSGGMVPSNLAGMDRNLLYPAIRAVAQNPVGACRSSLSRIYDNLNQTDYQALADTIVYSAYELTPADKMFAYQDRFAAQRAMKRFNTAEGVPLCLLAVEDAMYGDMNQQSLATLQLYAGSSKTVKPEPGVEAAMDFLIQTGTNAAEAQAVLDAIAGDPNPSTLTPLKSIQSVTADAPILTLPTNWTILRVASNDFAKGDSVYTWRKIHGAGNVSFTPNGTASSNNTTVLFDGTPGQYLFEVKMSDSLGLTEVTMTVAVTLNPNSGSLPTNNPPVANNQSSSVPQATATPITLSGSDPEGFALNYRLTSQPTHGQLTGSAPYLVYTSDFSYTGPDAFTFEVQDSEGQTSTAAVSITVTAVSNPPGLPALSGNGTTGSLTEYNEADGYRFQTGASALTVNWLGIYDAPNGGTGTVGDGLQSSHSVSIWRESDGVLIAQTSVLTSDALAGSFRNHNITPVTLAANTGYVIAADYGSTGDRLREGVNTAEWGVYSGISNLAGRYGGAGGGMPTTNYSVMIGPNFGYAVVPSDNVSPSPNPMAFHQAPAAASPSSVNMMAVSAFDPSDVEYYFTCTAGGGHDSGWQDSPSYTDTGLTPGLLYSYTVKARDKSPALNQTTASPAASVTISTQSTLPNLVGMPRATAESILTMLGMTVGSVTLTYDSLLPPGTVLGQTPAGNQTLPLGTVVALTVAGEDILAPTPNRATFAVAPAAANSSSITMTASTGSDPSGVEYQFTETSGNPGGSSSAWQDSPVFTDSGLSPATQYTYTVTIRDKSPAANPTAPSAPSSATTNSVPAAPSWYWDGGNSDIVTNGNGASTGGSGTWDNILRNWDVGNTPHAEWNNAANKTAVFGGTAGTVTIGGGGVTVGDMQLTSATYTINGAPLTISGTSNLQINVAANIQSVLTGNFGLTKAGTGTLTLSGANTYTGTTTVTGGILAGSVTNFLPLNSNVAVNTGGTFKYATSGNVNALNVALNGGTLALDGGNTSFGTLALNANSTIDGSNVNFQTNTITAPITGIGGLTKTGLGPVRLNGVTNEYSGPTVINAGALLVKSSLYGNNTAQWTPANITVANNSVLSLNVGGAGEFTAGQAATMFTNLTTNVNNNGMRPGSFMCVDTRNAPAGTTIYPAVLADSTGTGGGAVNFKFFGSSTTALELTGANTYSGVIMIENNGTLRVSSFNSVTTNPGLGTVHSASSSLGAPTTVANGTIWLGTGGWNGNSHPGTTYQGANLTYTGTGETTDRVLNIGGANGSTYRIDQSGSGLLKFISNITATETRGPKNFILQGSTSGQGEFAGVIPNVQTTAPLTLTKSGSGTWTLSGTNTYTGTTNVTGGTLACSSAASLGSGALNINTGAKLQLNFAGTRQVASLKYNSGTALANGTYGSTASTATNKNDTYFAGTGTVTVGPLAAVTTTTLALSGGSTPSVFGATLTFTATVTGSTPTGNVSFFAGTTPIGTSALNGSFQASLNTTTLPVGSYQITARYDSDVNNQTSTSAALAIQVTEVTPSTPTNLRAAPLNNRINLTWTVSNNATSYAVKRSQTNGGPYTVIGNPTSASFEDLTVVNGTTYHYVVSAINGAGESANSNQVSGIPGPQPSTTTLVSSPVATGPYGTSVTFTATVSGGPATGTVTFLDGSTVLGTGALSAGTASFTTTTLAAANHTITASYGGDTNFVSSVSAPSAYLVTPISLTITGVTASNKIYDGNAAATLSGGTVSGGVISGETVTVVPGNGTFASANAGTWAVAATGYALGGANAGNYQLSAQPTVPNGTITPRPLQLTGTRTYDATTLADAADLTISNKVSGDNLTLTGSADLVSKDVGTRDLLVNIATPARVQSKTGFSAGNTSTSFTVTLNAAPASGNTLIAVISTRGTSAGRVNGITSTGAVWARVAQSTNSSGSTTEIWSALVGSGATTGVTISTAAGRCAAVVVEYSGLLTVNAVDQIATSLGATSAAPLTGTTPLTTQASELWIGGIGHRDSSATLGSILNSFTSVASAESNSATVANNAKVHALERIVSANGMASSGGTLSASVIWSGAVATFKAFSNSTLALTGSSAENYTLTGLIGSMEITPKALTLTTTPAVTNKVYDGLSTATLTGTALQGAEAAGTGTSNDGKPYTGDAVALVLNGSFNSKDAGVAKVVTSTSTLSGAQKDNYTLTQPIGVTGTIMPAGLSITADDQNKTYGQTLAFGSGATQFTSIGLLNSETIDSVTLTSGGGGPAAAVAPYPITPSAATGETFNPANYNINYASGTLTLKKASQTISFGPLADRIDGDAPFALTATTNSGLAVGYSSSDPTVASVSGSTVTVLKAGSTTLTASQAGDANHHAATPIGQTLNVNPALTSFEAWATNPAHGLTEGINDGPLDDPDHDGFSNLLEFVLGGEPMASSQAIRPTLTKSGEVWVFSYHRSHLSTSSTSQVVEHGNGLTGWTPLTIPADTAGAVTITPGASSDHVEVSIPPQGTNGFARLKVVITP